MSNKTIYYATLTNDGSVLKRQINLVDKHFVFSKCPVVNHKLNRTFVCESPIDFYVEIDRENKNIQCSNPELLVFDDEHLYGASKPVVQMSFCKFLFWTNEKDIWFEFNDHPMTSYNNNFISLNGWFNLSSWPRATSIAGILVDEKNPLIIKKGDPLFRVSFYSSNLNDGIILQKEENYNTIESVYRTMNKNKNSFKKDNMLRKLFFKSDADNTTSSKNCPFRFLYK